MAKLGRGRKKRNNDHERKLIYNCMVKASKALEEDGDSIINMTFFCNGYGMKFVADNEHRGVYSVYGCNFDGRCNSRQPFYIGYVEEIVTYLNDKSNIDDVMQYVCDDSEG